MSWILGGLVAAAVLAGAAVFGRYRERTRWLRDVEKGPPMKQLFALSGQSKVEPFRRGGVR